MKETLSILLSVVFLLTFSMLTASAEEYEYVTAADYYENNAAKADEVYDTEAGIASTRWTIPYLEDTPVLDGEISRGEYARLEDFEDYLFYSMRMNGGENSVEEFWAFLDIAKNGFFDAYWGWDGEYLYMAFDMDCIDGYFCDPSIHGTPYLYACTSVQFGIGQADCEYRDFTEVGFGINPDGDQGVSFKWMGPSSYFPDALTDVAGQYDEKNNRLFIEFRVDLEKALNLDDPVDIGDQAKICWVLNVGGTGDNLRIKSVSFCHGITGTQSVKAGQYFATVTFGDMSQESGETTEEETTVQEEPPSVEQTSEEMTDALSEQVTETPTVSEKPTEESEEELTEFPLQETEQESKTELSSKETWQGGLVAELTERLGSKGSYGWKGCTSAIPAYVLPMVAILGMVFLRKKND